MAKEKISKEFAKYANVMFKRTGSKIYEGIRRMEGTKGSMTVSKEQLKYLPQEVQRAIKPLLQGAENPTAQIAYKAKSNYNVAAIKIQDGGRVVGTGAISLTNPGKANGVLKARINVPDKAYANGYLDGSAPLKADDVLSSVLRRGGKVKADVEISKGVGFHLNADEKETKNLLSALTPDRKYGIPAKWNEMISNVQKRFTEFKSRMKEFFTEGL